MPKQKKILYNAEIRQVANGWIVIIKGSVEHYYPSAKEWMEFERADNERYFPTLKQAVRFLRKFRE